MFNSDLPADSSKIRYSAGYIRQNFKVLETVLGADVLSEGTHLGIFDKGTRLWFYQDVAPTGWSIVPGVGDSLLGIKADGGALQTTGGSIAGTWQLPDHVLTIEQMPTHHHSNAFNSGANSQGYFAESLTSTRSNSRDAQLGSDVGGSQPHNHGNSWRPQTACGIIAEKS